ncbi:MAG: DUF5763 domain-containing protein [Elusimicrobiota bacterium]
MTRCIKENCSGERCKKEAEIDGYCMFHFLRKVGNEDQYREKVKEAFEECLEDAKRRKKSKDRLHN